MFPSNSSQPHPPQIHSNGLSGSATPKVVGNPGMEVQPQMGFFRPQGSSTSNSYPSVPRFPFQAPQNPINNAIPQMPGQFFAHNVVNPSQFFNQNANVGLPNNQWNLSNNNLIQTVNQLMQTQMQMQIQMQMQMQLQQQSPNFAQAGPSVLPFFATNQAFQAPHAFNGNTQFQPVNGVPQQPMNANLLKQPQQGNAPSVGHPHLNLGSSNFSGAAKSQGGPEHATRFNSKGHWNNSFSNNLNRNQGFQKPTTQSFKNAKKSFGNQGVGLVKGHFKKDGTEKSFKKQHQTEEPRKIPFLYAEQEVRQWREERKRNYPSKANIAKKSQKLANAEDSDAAAKLRRQQLKEILAKQAELGCEIAEIPPSYFSDLDRPCNGGGDKRRAFDKKEKFQNRPNKRGRFGQKSSSSRNQTPETQERKREPTLLKKLLGGDINRDKRHLLQVLRFMAMNSFFVACPGKPLKFPCVIVKEPVCGSVGVDQELALGESSDDEEDVDGVTGLDKGRKVIPSIVKEEPQEEGEIVD